ncbi:MAG: 4-diphosphocytidyl-2-C-methyl-D-erythritol kinase [Thermotogaceae bacterium]|jgi:4-diphosphocytidyl-2-C-methyl-D-erythritol kinase|nr:4-diphosphocytidyl-2-C-methyl-D-erythritol kinase [Thermotogaceae bacterium]MDN5337133.1 4-diphosphocytidyl-2-C-methyl-D-erythritol kinase [Thermotogaceae bacterium]
MYRCYCYSKLNLYLDVLKKRSDGYHEIISLFQTISLYDSIYLELLENEVESVVFKSNDPSLKWDENNSIFRAFEEFKRAFGPLDKSLFIFLKKRIPKACGLGGESTDAAGILLILAELKSLKVDDVAEIAKKVGSDVKFFLTGGTALVSGRGEKVERLEPLKNWSVNLKIPPFYFKTPEMYRLIDENCQKIEHKGSAFELYESLRSRDFARIRSNLFNVFEQVALLKEPDIVSYKNSDLVCMTGSGPAFFELREGILGRYVFIDTGNKVERIHKKINELW